MTSQDDTRPAPPVIAQDSQRPRTGFGWRRMLPSGRMVLLWLGALAPVLASLFTTWSAPVAAPLDVTADRPALLFSEYLFDYGPYPVAPQPLLTPTIEFRNHSDEPVTIADLRASCGCVEPRVSKMTVAPGAVERITIPIRTVGEKPGQREYSVTVLWTDSQPREATLTVRVVLPEQLVAIEPRVLGIVGSNSRAIEHAVTVSDYRDDPLLVESATSSSSLIRAEVLKRTVGENGSRATVAVHVSGDTPPGIHRAIVQFRTDDPDHAYLQMPVLLQGGPRPPHEQIIVRPELLRLPGNEPDADPRLLRIEIPAAWKVSHINAFPPQLQTPFEEVAGPSEGRREIHVQVSLSAVPPGRPEDGVITLVAEDGKQMVSVPVSFAWPVSL